MKKEAIKKVFSFILTMVIMVLYIPAIQTNAGEYERASQRIQVYTQWNVDAYGHINQRWMNGSGCGWFSLGHALQWLRIINRDVESRDSMVGKLYIESGYISTVNRLGDAMYFLAGKYGNFGYERNDDVVSILNNGGVALYSKYGHYVVAVELSSDGRFVHIVDSCLWVPYYNQVTVYQYVSGSFNEVSTADCAVKTDNYWYCDDVSTSKMLRANKPNNNYSGGDYWVTVSEVRNINYAYGLYNTCTHDDNYKTKGVCSNCGAYLPWENTNNDRSGLYNVTESCNVKAAPYAASETISEEKLKTNTLIYVNCGVINGFDNKWYEVDYKGKIGYIYSTHISYAIEQTFVSGNFYLQNKATGLYLTAEGQSSGTETAVYSYRGDEYQRFNIITDGYFSLIKPEFDSGLNLNPAGDDLVDGMSLNILKASFENGNDQHWLLQKTIGGYLIRNAKVPDLVVSETNGNVVLEYHDNSTILGNRNHYWEFICNENNDQIKAVWSEYPAKQWISEENAVIARSISLSGAKASEVNEVGCYLYNSSGNLIANKSEGASLGDYSSFYITWDCYNELNYKLTPGTEYKMKMYFKIGDKVFESEEIIFTTLGEKEITGISVKSVPDKITYVCGEELDTAGLTISVMYSDGSEKILTSGFTVSGFSSETVGEKTVTVTYKGKTAFFKVTVNSSVPQNAPQIIVDKSDAVPGGEVKLMVYIKNNPGVSYIRLTPSYDTSVLTLTKISNEDTELYFGRIGWEKHITLENGEDVKNDGSVFALTFKIYEDAIEGVYQIDLIFREACNYNEHDVVFTVIPGSINVKNIIYGDANGDGVVNGKDIVRLRKYIDNYDDDTHMSTESVSRGADANGDGEINGKDIIRLRKYIDNYDDNIGTSPIILGP